MKLHLSRKYRYVSHCRCPLLGVGVLPAVPRCAGFQLLGGQLAVVVDEVTPAVRVPGRRHGYRRFALEVAGPREDDVVAPGEGVST